MQLTKVGELGGFIRDQRRTARLSLRKLSHMAGISNPYLSQIERGLRRPSAEILQAIAKALRISAETLYVKAGILEERDGAADPITSLLRDRTLTEKQKQVIIEIYQSFRHDNDESATDPAALKAVALSRSPRAAKKAAVKKAAPKKRSVAKKTSRKKPVAKKTAKRTTKKSARRTAPAKPASKTRKPSSKKRSTKTTKKTARKRR